MPILAAVCLLSGCRTPLSEEPRNAPWTLSELENRAAGSDPIEPFNRAMFSVQHVILEYPVDWIGRVYTSILPRPVIQAVDNLCLNLEFPARFISSLLRAEWRGSWHELLRFLANSTLGIAGLFDVGYYWFDLHSTDSDFGQTFHAWGIDPGCTLILPFLPRVNVRDAGGFIFDCAFDAKTYIPYSSVVMLNQVIMAQNRYHGAVAGAGDPYKTYREAMVLRRELQHRLWFYRLGDRKKELFMPPADFKLPPPVKVPDGVKGEWVDLRNFGQENGVNSTLRTVKWQPQQRSDWWYMPLSLFNSDFAGKMKKLYVELPNGGEVVCGFWEPAKKKDTDDEGFEIPSRLAVIMPGIGGSHDGTSTMALAELLTKNQFAVLTVDCAFSGSFMEQTRSGKFPGNVEHDAKVLYGVLDQIMKTIEKKGWVFQPQMLLAGYSFGGLYALKIAEMEFPENKLGFGRYLAINPPVELKYASEQADSCSRAGGKWSEKETFERLTEAAGRAWIAAQMNGDPGHIAAMSLFRVDKETGRFLAGLYFKLPLRHILFSAAANGMKTPLKTPYSWWRRNALYLEIDKVGFEEYAGKFAAPCFPGETLAGLYAKGDMRNFRRLKDIPGIKVFHTWDDPLLNDGHRRWLDRTFGKNLVWFSRGGHLGNMYLPEVMAKIMEGACK
ncbi:MAG: VacJ family lipoprotein [Lentisphaeria bacterium]|nr:VacJ family lipoprotein [Lentisphaeria bacterium]